MKNSILITSKDVIKVFIIFFVITFLAFSLEEVTGEKFPIGSTRLHDSTASIFTINKSTFINGEARVSSIRFKEYNSQIIEGLSELQFQSPAVIFQTINEEPVLSLDSSTGLELYYGDLKTNYLKTGTDANSPTYWIKEIRFKLGASTNAGYTFAHGVSDIKKIRQWTCIVTDDSAQYSYAPLSWYQPYLYYARLTNTSCQVTIPVNAYGVVSDSAIFTLRINK